MKRILFTILFLLFASLSSAADNRSIGECLASGDCTIEDRPVADLNTRLAAGPGFVGMMSSSSAAGPNQWYYTNGSDTYDGSASQQAGYALCSDVSVTAGTATKLSVKSLTTVQTAKIAIYDTSYNLLSGTCTTGELVSGWNDCTLSPSYAVSTATYRLCYDLANTKTIVQDAAGTTYWGAHAYATFPQNPLTGQASGGGTQAIRIFVQ